MPELRPGFTSLMLEEAAQIAMAKGFGPAAPQCNPPFNHAIPFGDYSTGTCVCGTLRLEAYTDRFVVTVLMEVRR